MNSCLLKSSSFNQKQTFPACSLEVSISRCSFLSIHSPSEGGAAYINQNTVTMVLSDDIFLSCSTEKSYGSIYNWVKEIYSDRICTSECTAQVIVNGFCSWIDDSLTNNYETCNNSVCIKCPPSPRLAERIGVFGNGILIARGNNVTNNLHGVNFGFEYATENPSGSVLYETAVSNYCGGVFWTNSDRSPLSFKLCNVVNNSLSNIGPSLFVCQISDLIMSESFIAENTHTSLYSGSKASSFVNCAFYNNGFTGDVPGTTVRIVYREKPCAGIKTSHFSKKPEFNWILVVISFLPVIDVILSQQYI